MEAHNERRIAEAREEMATGDEALRTGLFKWTANYDKAARAYENAGSRFRGASMFKEAKEAFLKSSQCKMKSNSPFFAAKQLEQACMVTEKQIEEETDTAARVQLVKDAASYMMEASEYYKINNKYDRALESVHKAAKICEQDCPEMAMRNYKLMLPLAPFMDKAGKVGALDGVRDGFMFGIGSKSFGDVVEMLKLYIQLTADLEQETELVKACLTTVVIHLASGDGQAAGQAFNSLTETVPMFHGSEEWTLAEKILGAYGDKDEDALTAAKKLPVVLKLDRVVVHCIRNLSTSGAAVQASAFSVDKASIFAADGEPNLCGGGQSQNAEPAVPADDDLC